MTEGPLISVVTVALNDLEGLQRTARSVASQAFKDAEHIVVDGASVDGSAEWLATNPYGIRWISEPDDGIGDALNKGVEIANGEWILVLQAQDELIEDASLEEASRWLVPGADVVCFDVLFVTETRSRRLRSRGFSRRINFKPLPHQGAFTRRSLFTEVGGFDPSLRMHMDYDFYLRAHRSGARAITTKELLSTMPDSGITSGRDWESLQARFREERLIQSRYEPSGILRLVYALYWPPYLVYRRIRALGHRASRTKRAETM